MPDRMDRIQTHKPAEQQVVIELLHKHALGANAVDRLQQQGQEQLLGRDRGPAAFRIELEKVGLSRSSA